VSLFYRAILPPIHERFQDDLAGASRLQGQEVKDALHGVTGTRWRSSPDGKAIIVSAATPVYDGNVVRGAVVVEETTGGIQMLQRQAMISLFNKTFLVFFLVTAAVLLFATRLSYRLRRLSRSADAAIDEHGRVIGGFEPARSGDEIGELSRRFGAMLERLRQYTGYLEQLAGRLSHELRTPITVVRSSLDHLQDPDEMSRRSEYLKRARTGVERLDLLVSRLSEASRLEQALQHADLERMDMGEFLARCVSGYGLAYPGVKFVLHGPPAGIVQPIGPDLFEQMLDKLVANAVDFHSPGTEIEVGLDMDADSWTLSVINYGAALPDAMAGQLFNSMISVRTGSADAGRPHLGLGLYIVRLIADFHGGRVRAVNLPAGDGVRFEVIFPRAV
jgi:signal transduction histidine kinase